MFKSSTVLLTANSMPGCVASNWASIPVERLSSGYQIRSLESNCCCLGFRTVVSTYKPDKLDWQFLVWAKH